MAETKPKSSSKKGGVEGALTRKFGGVPAYTWLGGFLAVVIWWRNHQASTGASTPTAAGSGDTYNITEQLGTPTPAGGGGSGADGNPPPPNPSPGPPNQPPGGGPTPPTPVSPPGGPPPNNPPTPVVTPPPPTGGQVQPPPKPDGSPSPPPPNNPTGGPTSGGSGSKFGPGGGHPPPEPVGRGAVTNVAVLGDQAPTSNPPAGQVTGPRQNAVATGKPHAVAPKPPAAHARNTKR